MKGNNGLINYLRLGNGLISKIYNKNLDEINETDNIWTDFTEYIEESNDEIKNLCIEIDDDVNFQNKNDFLDYLKKYQNLDILFLFNLFLSRNRYLEYLTSDIQEFRDDLYIIPLIINYNKDKNINVLPIIFDNQDNNIYIKEQLISYNNINTINNNLCFLYLQDNIYDIVCHDSSYTGGGKSGINIEEYNKILLDKNILDNFRNYSKDTYLDDIFTIEYLLSIYKNEILFVYINSSNTVSHIGIKGDKNKIFILPYICNLDDKLLKGVKKIYDLEEYIKNSESLENYRKLLDKLYKGFSKNKSDSYENILNKEYYDNYFIKGLSVVEGKVSDIILNNNTYIPLNLEDVYDEDMEIVLVEYNLYDMDKQLQLEELDSDNIFSNNDEDDVKIKNEEKLNKILYYYLKNNEHKDIMFIRFLKMVEQN